MVEYKCLRCGFICNQKGSLLQHLSRKKQCESILNNISNSKILKYNNILDYNKTKYNIIVKKTKTKTKTELEILQESHKDILKNFDILQKSHKELLKKFEKLTYEFNKTLKVNNNSNNNSNNNNNNSNINSNNNNINITINNFESERIDYITNKLVSKYINNFDMMYMSFIKNLHFNNKYPENHNIRILDYKSGLGEIYDNKKWIKIPIMDFNEKIIINLGDKLYTLNNELNEKENPEEYNINDKKLELIEEKISDINYIKKKCKNIKVSIANLTRDINESKKIDL